MGWLFHPRLINGPFDDPGLFIPFQYEKRALLFDLGDIYSLSARDILKITHVFVTHTHMDHFVGFDRLLRLFLGREKSLHLYGPDGFLKNVEGKLDAYSWNLTSAYNNQFALLVTEVHSDKLIKKRYLCGNRFQPEGSAATEPFSGVLLKEPALSVSTVILDHSIPCLGFSVKERFHVNIKKDSVEANGLDIGPWLGKFKQALFNHNDPDSLFEVHTSGKKEEKEGQNRFFTLGDLANRIAKITPGQKVAYITDVVYSRSNAKKIIEFAKDANYLFIETAFLDKDRDIAKAKFHLTARQAGIIGNKARVKNITPFHFSPRYSNKEQLLYNELKEAFENSL